MPTTTKPAAPVDLAQFDRPQSRDGSTLNWLVVNQDGKLLAVLDSESEAYYFTKNRGHAEGAVYFKAPCDYAAAPDLLSERRDLRARNAELVGALEDLLDNRVCAALYIDVLRGEERFDDNGNAIAHYSPEMDRAAAALSNARGITEGGRK